MDAAGLLMLGRSARMRGVRTLLRQSARRKESVLIEGPIGTGKTLAGRTIHAWSDRRVQPLETLDCSALTETLFEVALYGVVKSSCNRGAAVTQGALDRARGGTLFLEEVGQLTPSAQVKLERLIETWSFERVGGVETLTADVRLVTSSFCPLAEKVKSGEFREELYRRLSELLITLPALDERPEDLEELVHHFLARHAQLLGRPGLAISPGAIALLATKRFFGNVRDLESYLQVLVAKAPLGTRIIDEGLLVKEGAFTLPLSRLLVRAHEMAELRRAAQESLSKAGGNLAQAAADLGNSVRRLHYLLGGPVH